MNIQTTPQGRRKTSKKKKETLEERVQHIEKTLGLMAHALEGMGKFMENTNTAVVGMSKVITEMVNNSQTKINRPTYIE